ncbi:7-carboxy-7-deazaguanine synthase [Neisseria dentiae]|uniref:7-carboxy-7-deazaguanine synthase n=1 Tax=Neisseria dentiae TaxID=194197 RepID=A0A1X3DF61_9NEIS|nr:7-carboxy-7-deazaguanine synthase QueE [Neisseria dentiae]OSI18553.1 7-carboxy-7-deazaguanine synthase [Neisseria dentiae]QMT45555.1 7-carboxy-7-deazaguanine synthase QueE [Neisseria dentiae]STZ51470.1 radical SAM domain-containing protein [Neisseria dentiae]
MTEIRPENPAYRIVEIFESLQGEGYNTGMSAVFIRLGKCNLACAWCDTDYLTFTMMSLADILGRLKSYTARNIIITGGEPTIQPHLAVLLDALKSAGYRLYLETNGLNPAPPQIDYVAASPKACYAAKYEQQCIETADEVRIVADGDVLAFCAAMEQKIRAEHYYLSPCERKGEMNIYETIRQIGLLNSRPDAAVHWQLSVQTHKWAGIE